MYREMNERRENSYKRVATTYRKSTGRSRGKSILTGKVFKLSLFGFAFVFMCLTALIYASASNSVEDVKVQYKSVLVEEGDTLWSIAGVHNDQTYSCISNSEYIDNVMSINNISGDYITAGNYIIVPVYVGAR